MNCTKCKDCNTKVLDSRVTDSGKAIRRRRECTKCTHRFTTFERIESSSFIVVKKDGTRENYDREKVKRGIWKACEKRKVTEKQVLQALTKIEENLSAKGNEISSVQIGELIMEMLKKLDEVAYIRFASVYRQFKDIDEFKRELQNM